MKRKQNLFFLILIITICVLAVFALNQKNRADKYKKANDYYICVKDSITEKEAEKINHAGGIRNDEANPRYCQLGREVFYER